MKWLRFSCWLNGHALINWRPNDIDAITCRCGKKKMSYSYFYAVFK